MSATLRYVTKPNTPPLKGVEMYRWMTFDSEASRPIAFAMTEELANGYTEQMNEKGFIEP